MYKPQIRRPLNVHFMTWPSYERLIYVQFSFCTSSKSTSEALEAIEKGVKYVKYVQS